MEDATVQRFASGVVGGRADASATAVGQRVPGGEVIVERGQAPCGGGLGQHTPLPGILEASPVKEGGEEAPQQDLVPRARTDVAVHELCPRDVHVGAWRGETEGGWGPQTATYPTRPGPLLRAPPQQLQGPRAVLLGLGKGQRWWRHCPWGTYVISVPPRTRGAFACTTSWVSGRTRSGGLHAGTNAEGQILNHCAVHCHTTLRSHSSTSLWPRCEPALTPASKVET